ncbi:MAG: hypothetical protein PHD87_07675 [Candidatus Cloacimonetes bacterium]|nr:hypothetical protein [Candidatus Cloacimonadota bacterium]
MKIPTLTFILLALATLTLAQTAPRSHPLPGAPYVERHSALDAYPFKNGELDQLHWEDFGLKSKVRKMYIRTSDIIWEPGSLRDHVIVRFDSLGKVLTTITYPHSSLPRGFRYHYRPDGQLQRVERYAYQDGFDTQTADQDNVFPALGTEAEYYYDELGYLSRIVFYDENNAVSSEHLYSYTADGYSIAINYTVPSRRHRDLIHHYDRQGNLVSSQKKDSGGKFIYTAKYSLDAKKNKVTILQDYLNNAATQTTTNLLDAGGRIKESTVNDFQGNLMRKYTNTYDSEGRLSKQAYNSPNDRITTIYRYETDAQGNLVEFSSSQEQGTENHSLSIRYEYY